MSDNNKFVEAAAIKIAEQTKILLPGIIKKVVIVSIKREDLQKVDIVPFMVKSIEKMFYRGIIVDELIDIETEIEDVILNGKFGLDSPTTRARRDWYREQKLRKKGQDENDFTHKTKQLIITLERTKAIDDQDTKNLFSFLRKSESFRHHFAHKEMKYDDKTQCFLYHDGERRYLVDEQFMKKYLAETTKIKELLVSVKEFQEKNP